jgi:hypothetical protein
MGWLGVAAEATFLHGPFKLLRRGLLKRMGIT